MAPRPRPWPPAAPVPAGALVRWSGWCALAGDRNHPLPLLPFLCPHLPSPAAKRAPGKKISPVGSVQLREGAAAAPRRPPPPAWRVDGSCLRRRYLPPSLSPPPPPPLTVSIPTRHVRWWRAMRGQARLACGAVEHGSGWGWPVCWDFVGRTRGMEEGGGCGAVGGGAPRPSTAQAGPTPAEGGPHPRAAPAVHGGPRGVATVATACRPRALSPCARQCSPAFRPTVTGLPAPCGHGRPQRRRALGPADRVGRNAGEHWGGWGHRV